MKFNLDGFVYTKDMNKCHCQIQKNIDCDFCKAIKTDCDFIFWGFDYRKLLLFSKNKMYHVGVAQYKCIKHKKICCITGQKYIIGKNVDMNINVQRIGDLLVTPSMIQDSLITYKDNSMDLNQVRQTYIF